MVYAWLMRVGHDVYEPKGIIITPVQEGFGGVYVELRGERQRRRKEEMRN